MVRSTNLVVVCDKQKTLSRMFKSEGQEKLSKNPDFVARVEKSLSLDSFWVDKKRNVKES